MTLQRSRTARRGRIRQSSGQGSQRPRCRGATRPAMRRMSSASFSASAARRFRAIRDGQVEGPADAQDDARADARQRPTSAQEPVGAGDAHRQHGRPGPCRQQGDTGLGVAQGAVEAPGALGQDGHHATPVEDGLGRAVGGHVAATGLHGLGTQRADEDAHGALEEDVLGQERGASAEGWAQPSADEGRISVAHVVGGDDERTAGGQPFHAFHTDAGDGLEARASEEGDEAGVRRKAV